MQFNIPPNVAKDSPVFDAWLADSFRTMTSRIDQSGAKDMKFGVATVTGLLDVMTGLTLVQYVLVSFNDDPAFSGTRACAGRPAPTVGKVRLTVYDGGTPPVLSTVPIKLTWVAFGISA